MNHFTNDSPFFAGAHFFSVIRYFTEKLFATFSLSFLLFSCTDSRKEPPQTLFTDVAIEVGIHALHMPLKDVQRISSGAAWFDCDNDGDLDIYMTNIDGPNYLFRNNIVGKGEDTFTEIASGDARAIDSYCSGVAVADYDNDGDNDLFLANLNEDILLQNDGKGNFKNVTSEAFNGTKNFLFEIGASASWGDVNNDGWLDLYVANNTINRLTTALSKDHLFINNGGLPVTFTDRTDLLEGDQDHDTYEDLNAFGFLAMFTDYNLDGNLDIYVINDCPYGSEDNKLWRNNGDMTFTEISENTGPFTRGKFLNETVVNDCHNAMGITAGDPNHDGFPDYHFTNVHSAMQNTVLLQNTGEYLVNVSANAGFDVIVHRERVGTLFTWGTTFIDYDLDTWQDVANATGSLFGVNNQSNMLFHNEGSDIGGTPKFSLVSENNTGFANQAQSRTLIKGDYDMDGDPDLFLVNYDSLASLYRNNNRNGNHWLIVETIGAGPPLSNRNGIGAKVYVITPDNVRQFDEIRSGSSLGGGDDIAAYFGLGKHESCQVQVVWPSGVTQTIDRVVSDQRIQIHEPAAAIISPPIEGFLKTGEDYKVVARSTLDEKVQLVIDGKNMETKILSQVKKGINEFDWNVNDFPVGQEYSMYLIYASNRQKIQASEISINIVNEETPYNKITFPNKNVLVERGSSQKIQWEYVKQTGSISLYLWEGSNQLITIAKNVSNIGAFNWQVPDSLEGNNFRIQIMNEEGWSDFSDIPFAIVKKIIQPEVPAAVLKKRLSSSK